MKRKLYFLSIFFMIIYLVFLSFIPVSFLEKINIPLLSKIPLKKIFLISAAYKNEISARTAAVVDVNTGQVLYDKHMHIKSFPASLTKVLTTIIALEEGNLDDIVTVSKKAAYQEGSSIYLEVGEKIKLEDLLYGVMLASGNDASVAVAEHIAGTVDKFAKLMNIKAKKMGAKNSHFVNPSGLPDPNHFSTAYDQAMIMRYAIKNNVFRQITQTKHKTISWANNNWGRGLRNHNKLLWSYDDITGGKTGYTKAAGRCLVASSKRDSREVVAVVLDDPNDWLDIRNLLDYGLEEFKPVRIIDKGEIVYDLPWEESFEGELGLLTEKSIDLLVPNKGKIKVKKKIFLDEKLELPIKKGEVIGYLKLFDDNKMLAETKLIAHNDLNYNSIFLRFWYWINNLIL